MSEKVCKRGHFHSEDHRKKCLWRKVKIWLRTWGTKENPVNSKKHLAALFASLIIGCVWFGLSYYFKEILLNSGLFWFLTFLLLFLCAGVIAVTSFSLLMWVCRENK